MYLHLGNDYIVNEKDIIGIFDIENTSISKSTKDFLKKAEKNKNVVYCSYEMPKSFIVCENKKDKKVYISQMSCRTLFKRNKSNN